MSGVRLLVGTRKGAFVLTSDGKREKWEVSGPHFAGWEMYHLKGSPADPNRIYASQTSAWFGQIIQRSDDGGKTWFQPGLAPGEPTTTPDGMPKGESNKFAYDVSPETGKPLTTHMWYDGTQHPWEFKRVWHLEPSLTDPNHVYAGVEDAALFESKDGGENWKELAGLRGHGTGPKWQPGAGGMCLHSILLDPQNPQRIFIAISAAGSFLRPQTRRLARFADIAWPEANHEGASPFKPRKIFHPIRETLTPLNGNRRTPRDPHVARRRSICGSLSVSAAKCRRSWARG